MRRIAKLLLIAIALTSTLVSCEKDNITPEARISRILSLDGYYLESEWTWSDCQLTKVTYESDGMDYELFYSYTDGLLTEIFIEGRGRHELNFKYKYFYDGDKIVKIQCKKSRNDYYSPYCIDMDIDISYNGGKVSKIVLNYDGGNMTIKLNWSGKNVSSMTSTYSDNNVTVEGDKGDCSYDKQKNPFYQYFWMRPDVLTEVIWDVDDLIGFVPYLSANNPTSIGNAIFNYIYNDNGYPTRVYGDWERKAYEYVE